MRREKRFGMWFPPLKARIIDIIKRAGRDGIEKADLRSMLGMSPSCLKSHIWQINDLLEDDGVRIDGRNRARISGPR
jgi:predicted transcriptional regulator